MDFPTTLPNPRRVNVLTLGKQELQISRHTTGVHYANTKCVADGGGIRGISTLVILEHLMQEINSSIKNGRKPRTTKPEKDVQPHEIFELVAGTSTGGLIAVMLGKLGMTVADCIQAYHNISKDIFGKKHLRGRATKGLMTAKYSGKGFREPVRQLMASKFGGEEGFDAELRMKNKERDKIAW